MKQGVQFSKSGGDQIWTFKLMLKIFFLKGKSHYIKSKFNQPIIYYFQNKNQLVLTSFNLTTFFRELHEKFEFSHF